jgi:hypothetical protein
VSRRGGRGADAAAGLVCPGCGEAAPDPSERFCASCGMPLVLADAGEDDVVLTPAQERARKVKKQYLDGPLVRVTSVRHQAEAELVQGMLLEEGVPSLVRRTGGMDVPDMMFAGARDVLVPQAGYEVARQVLGQSVDGSPAPPRPRIPREPRSRRTRATAVAAAFALVVGTVGPVAALVWWQLHG